MSDVDWKKRAVEAERQLAELTGKPQFNTLKEELTANISEPEASSESGTRGYFNPLGLIGHYFEDKPDRNFKIVGTDEIYNGRNAWPPFTEVVLFEVDDQLYLVEGESDSWEGMHAIYDMSTVRAVRKVSAVKEVNEYVSI